MAQQRGQKRLMIENNQPVVQGQHFHASPSGVSSYNQDGRRDFLQMCQEEQLRVMTSYINQQQQAGLSQPSEIHKQHGDKSFTLNGSSYDSRKRDCLVLDFVNELRDKSKDTSNPLWRNFVAKFFTPGAKYRLCVCKISVVSLGDHRCCNICRHNPANGIEVEVVPSLFRTKYDTGTLEEQWILGSPKEYHNTSGQTILDYERATQETIYDKVRVVHEGQLRVVLNPDNKIYSWEFCVCRFEEFVPRSLMTSQLIQLREGAQRFNSNAQNISSYFSAQLMQDDCKRILESTRELTDALESPLDVNFGYSETYVHFLQVGATFSGESMKTIMKYSKETGASPLLSLKMFRSMTNSLPVKHVQALHHESHGPAVEEQRYKRVHSPPQTPRPNLIPAVQERSEAGPAALRGPEGLASHTQFQKSFAGNKVETSPRPNLIRAVQERSEARPASLRGPEGSASHSQFQQSFAGNKVGTSLRPNPIPAVQERSEARPTALRGPEGLASQSQFQQSFAGNKAGTSEPQSSSEHILDVGNEGGNTDAIFDTYLEGEVKPDYTSASSYLNDPFTSWESDTFPSHVPNGFGADDEPSQIKFWWE